MELFPVNIKLAWKTKQKQQELTKNQSSYFFGFLYDNDL